MLAALGLAFHSTPVQAAAPVEYSITDDEGPRVFVVAEDEIEVNGPHPVQGPRRLSTLQGPSTPLAAVESLRRAGVSASLVLYPQGRPRTRTNRRVLTRSVTVRMTRGADFAGLAARYGASTTGELAFAPGYAVLEVPTADGAPAFAEALRREPGVTYAEAMLGRLLARKATPSDPYYDRQWGLKNTGQNGAKPGVDVHIEPVWEIYRGEGILINIVDDGLQYTHPDLAANCNTDIDYDYRDDDDDPFPALGTPAGGEPGAGEMADTHGTAVAGVCAAVGNNGLGGVGSAFEATLIGVRLLGGTGQTDLQDATAIGHSNAIVHISNNSWGIPDYGQVKGGVGPLTLAALEYGALTGRGGKGTIFMWAAGNGGIENDNVGYDSYNSSIYTISVGALNDLGRRAGYSEPGACLHVVAPSGGDDSGGRMQATLTTDLQGEWGDNPAQAENGFGPIWPQQIEDPDYTQGFNGTSSATPLASGVVALMLQANPDLGWRDVQEILIRTAALVDPENQAWKTNAAGLHVNPNYGAGLIDATTSVKTALTWTNLGPQVTATASIGNSDIPDGQIPLESLDFDLSQSNLRVEHATLTVAIVHPARGELAIELSSPSGTISTLMLPHGDKNANLNHTFETVFNWGELSRGTWKAVVFDSLEGNAGFVRDMTLTVYGTEVPEGGGGGDDAGSLSLEHDGDDLVLTWDASGGAELETAPGVRGPWTPVSGPDLESGRYVVDRSAAPEAFFRLRK